MVVSPLRVYCHPSKAEKDINFGVEVGNAVLNATGA